MNPISPNCRLPFLFILVLISSIFSFSTTLTVEALVPKSKTFKYVNEGDTGYPEMEYGNGVRALTIYTLPFQLMFYGINNGGFTLGLAMVTTRFQDLSSRFRWVWAANRGNPVHENATLTFGTDGNLVLADADGRVAWQTGTANKGVVDLKLLPNGNLVLVDKRGAFAWQSFEHPTDTLLVGQSLVSGGKLVSRNSEDDSFGDYSLVAEQRSLRFYYKNNKNSASKPKVYDEITVMEQGPDEPVKQTKVLKNVTFSHFNAPNTKEGRPYSNLLRFEFFNNVNEWGSSNLAQQKYNSTFSFLRLESDATLMIYTLYDIETFYVPGQEFSPWEVTYTYTTTMCQLPLKCGAFGVCEQGYDRCIGCLTPNGQITPWNETCSPWKIPSCNANSYYKRVGVKHFVSNYEEGEGPIKVGQCKKKCSKDCKCVAAFYNTFTSKCILTTEFSTLIEDGDSSHLAFIKYKK